MKKDITRGLPLFSGSGAASAVDTFFQTKRIWSKRIKDRVLACYLKPYLSKVALIGERIMLIDGFAGPGLFDDGSKGSPLILCEAADLYAPNQCLGLFVNQDPYHHQKLTELLQPRIQAGKARCIQGDAQEFLKELGQVLKSQTVFLYLDPFGLKGCEFDSLKIFLNRSKAYSTEILINISPATIHRLAALDAIKDGRITAQVKALNDRLTRVLGGEYWKELLADESCSPAERVARVVDVYQKRLGRYLPYVGSCPVREKEGAAIKYYMIHCSRHPDALLLMNDQMCAAYNEYMYDSWKEGTLFHDSDWQKDRDLGPLAEIIMREVRQGRFGRKELNVLIVRAHFMRWRTVEYRDTVKRLITEGRLDFVPMTPTKRLNDRSLLVVPKLSASRVQHSA